MLLSIGAQNFKALGPGTIDVSLAPITVLVGENGAGKSSILDALAILAQTLKHRHDRTGLVIQGELTELVGDYSAEAMRRLSYRHATSEWTAIEVSVALDRPPLSERTVFLGGHPASWKGAWPPRSIRYRVETREDGHERREWKQMLVLDEREFGKWATTSAPDPRAGQIYEARLWGIPEGGRGFSSDRVLGQDLFNAFDLSKLTEHQRRSVEIARVAGDIFIRQLTQHISFVSSVRGAALFQSKTGPRSSTVGKHGEESLRLLNSLSQEGRQKVELLERWASWFGLDELRGSWLGGDELTATFVDPSSRTEIDAIAYAGSGSRQVLPILLELARAEAGQTVLLDEPEISLHPAWILRLAAVLVEAAQRGIQLVLATQNPMLVLALARAARSTKATDLLGFWQVGRGVDGASIKPTPLSPGGFLSDWPYANVDAELMKEMMSGQEEPPSSDAKGAAKPRSKRRPHRFGR